VYELRTAEKLKVLEGSVCPSSCLSFDPLGKFLASFSKADMKIYVWKLSSSNIFTNLLMSSNSEKPFKVFAIQNVPANSPQINKFTLQWTPNSKSLSLHGIDSQQICFFDV